MAMRIEIEADDEVGVCNAGHPRTPENTVWRSAGGQGKKYPSCRLCRNMSLQRLRLRKRGVEVVLPSFLSRKSPYRREEDEQTTVPLYSRLPKEMQLTLYGLVREGKGDPLTLRVLRVASEGQVWVGMSEHFAAIQYIDAVCDQVRVSRSLRIDRVLALLYQEPG